MNVLQLPEYLLGLIRMAQCSVSSMVLSTNKTIIIFVLSDCCNYRLRNAFNDVYSPNAELIIGFS